MGNDHDNRLKLAVDYLKYLGTAEMSPAQKEEEFYKLGCELSVNCSAENASLNNEEGEDYSDSVAEICK